MRNHVIARRGARALLAKTIFRSGNKPKEKKTELKENSSVRFPTVRTGDARKLSAFHIVAFPARVQKVLNHSPIAEHAYMILSGLVYSFLVRTDGKDGNRRPCWAKHMPIIYHRSKDLASSELAEPIASLSKIIEQKVTCSQMMAEVIFLLYQSTFPKSQDSPSISLVSLIRISEALKSGFTLMSCKLRTAIDDQFSTKISPYRGTKISRPEWNVLNGIARDALVERTGVALTVPTNQNDDSLAARFDDFISDLSACESAGLVFSLVIDKVFNLMTSYNSRCMRTSCNPLSVESMLSRPWSEDADLRAIILVYSNISKIVNARAGDEGYYVLPVLLANALIGGWIGLARGNIWDHQKCVQHEKHVEIPFQAEKTMKIFHSYTPVQFEYKQVLARIVPENAEMYVLKIQSCWRGFRIRNCKRLKILADFVKNSNWPDMAQEEAEKTTLTRASLLRLAGPYPSQSSLERPITPASSHKTTVLPEPSGSYFTQPDLIQADHIACVRLYFILVYNIYLRSRMVEYHQALLATVRSFVDGFCAMLARQPQYYAVLNHKSTELATRVVEAKAVALAERKASNVKKPKPVSLLNKLSKEIRDELLSKQLKFRDTPKLRKPTLR